MIREIVRVFAYGSNLSTARIVERVGAIEVFGTGTLVEHELRFHKRSKDGSTKADAYYTGRAEHHVCGAVYGLSYEAKAKLDRFEGRGVEYADAELAIEMASGERVLAWVYRARPDRIDAAGRPYDWYREHVLVGAREHGLPAPYIKTVARVEAVADPDSERRLRELAVSGPLIERG